MDPAYPHFSNAKPPIRLDRSAAYYVDIIHTDASAFIRGGLGLNERIGHVDYFPNGGTDQPGCDQNFGQYISAESGSFFRGVRKFLGCNHIRSHEYFAESINPKCPFATISCNSYEVSFMTSFEMYFSFGLRILNQGNVSNVKVMVNIALLLAIIVKLIMMN